MRGRGLQQRARANGRKDQSIGGDLAWLGVTSLAEPHADRLGEVNLQLQTERLRRDDRGVGSGVRRSRAAPIVRRGSSSDSANVSGSDRTIPAGTRTTKRRASRCNDRTAGRTPTTQTTVTSAPATQLPVAKRIGTASSEVLTTQESGTAVSASGSGVRSAKRSSGP